MVSCGTCHHVKREVARVEGVVRVRRDLGDGGVEGVVRVLSIIRGCPSMVEDRGGECG